MKLTSSLACLILLVFVSACSAQNPTIQPPVSLPSVTSTSSADTGLPSTLSPEPTFAPTLEPTPTPTETAPSSGQDTGYEQTPVASTAAPTESPSPTEPATSATGDCENKAAFFADITIPDRTPFQQGVAFTKTWRIRNEGTCTWGPEYSLAFSGGDIMNGPLNSPLPVVAPGEIQDISIDLVSPSQGGIFTGYYVFESPQGQRFGVNAGGIDTIWVEISVSWYPPGQSSPNPTPAPQQPGTPPAAACPVQEDPSIPSQLLNMINNARSTEGLPAFTLNSQLSAAALGHSADMACNGFLDHIGSNGSRWGDRISAQGYNYSYGSENIYAGSPDFGGDAAGAFDWWMNSQVHRNNILTRKATEIGIGYVYAPSSPYGAYYTLVFARP